MRLLAAGMSTVLFSAAAAAQHHGDVRASPYAGQGTPSVKALSEEDLEELRRGGGWGLAKAAELNGLPGPAHLLELKDDLPLTDEQVVDIRALFERMRQAAIAEGQRLIALEQGLDAAFRERTITEPELRRMLADIEASRAALRYIHLAAHLETPNYLTETQIARYNELRGYSIYPCERVPPGHDAKLWRRHNGCQ